MRAPIIWLLVEVVCISEKKKRINLILKLISALSLERNKGHLFISGHGNKSQFIKLQLYISFKRTLRRYLMAFYAWINLFVQLVTWILWRWHPDSFQLSAGKWTEGFRLIKSNCFFVCFQLVIKRVCAQKFPAPAFNFSYIKPETPLHWIFSDF